MTRNLIERNRFKELLTRFFSSSELEDLGFRLGIDLENLPGVSKADKARELIEYTERRLRLDELLAAARDLRPEVDWPAAEALASATFTPERPPPAPTAEPPIEVQTVRIQYADGRGMGAGFFTANGFILAFAMADVGEATVSWRRGGSKWEADAKVVKRGGGFAPDEVALLSLVGAEAPRLILPVRNSTSLEVGDPVERFLGSNDTTPGKVVAVSSAGGFLVTTRISFAGDAGAPVLDSEGRVVGMVYSASASETNSVAIERIKVTFPEAF